MTDRDPLADLFAEHRADDVERDCLPSDSGGMAWVYARRCECGWHGPSDQHDAHLAAVVRAYLTSDETVEQAARATTGGFANTSGEPDELDEWEPWDADWWRGQVRAALAAASEAGQ